jgi:DNA invertase Pin-like site-specific DNA recombinase
LDQARDRSFDVVIVEALDRLSRDMEDLTRIHKWLSFLGTEIRAVKEVDDGIWLASFMNMILDTFDLEQKTLQPLDNPFGTRLSPMS